MRTAIPLLALPLLASAACATVPSRFQGQYIRESALRVAQNGGLFASGDHANLELTVESAVVEAGGERQIYGVVGVLGSGDGVRVKLVERGRAERFMEVENTEAKIPRRRPEHLEIDATWEIEVERGRAVLSTGEERWIRIADVIPAAAGMTAASVNSASLFSRGFTIGSEVWVIVGRPVRGVADLRRTGDEVWTQFRGGYDAPLGGQFGAAPLMQIGHETYVLEQRAGGVRLIPATAGPSAKGRRGEAVIDLTEMEAPPFLVLRNEVRLHATPDTKAAVLGHLPYLTAVAPWVRTDEIHRVGALEGHWYLVQAGAAIGWVFGAYLGQRLHPVRMPLEPPPLWQVEPVDTDLRVAFGHGRDGPVCRFETSAGSFDLQKKAPACIGAARQRCSTEIAPYWGDGDRALGLLADLNGDTRADLVCVIEKRRQLAICPALSVGEAGFIAAGCLLHPGPELPAITAVDRDGEGSLDLDLGGIEPIHFSPASGRYEGAIEARLEAGLPGLLAYAATEVRRETDGRIVAVTLRSPTLKAVPAEIGGQADLVALYVAQSPVRELPSELTELPRLETLYVEDGDLRAVPAFLGEMASLRDLDLSGNRIEALPPELLRLAGLKRLDLSRNDLTILPEGIGELAELAVLELNGNRLTGLPASIGELTKLRILKLYGNQLLQLPEALRRLTSLEDLGLARTMLEELPPWLGEMRGLEGLGLANNRLANLPASIGDLSRLNRLDLSGNRFVALPATMQKLDALVEVHWNGRLCGRQKDEATKAFLERCIGLPWE